MASVQELQRYEWPGNVRELQHSGQQVAELTTDKERAEEPSSLNGRLMFVIGTSDQAETVVDDAAKDTINAGDGVDLFFAKLGGATADKVSGQKSNELLIPL